MGTLEVDASSLIDKMGELAQSAYKFERAWETATNVLFDVSQHAVHVRTGQLKRSGRTQTKGVAPGVVQGEIVYGEELENNSGHGYAVFEQLGTGYFKEGQVPPFVDLRFRLHPQVGDSWKKWKHVHNPRRGSEHDFITPVEAMDDGLYRGAMLWAMR